MIIPVGGEAKRLRPLTAEVSKASVRVFNRPIAEFVLAELALHGARHFIFGVKGYVNYRSLFDYFREGIGFSAQYGIAPRAHVKYQPPVEDVGNADSVRINLGYYDVKGPVMVVQGDNIFELDLEDLLSFHEEKGSFMTVVLTYVDDVEGYGIAELEGDQRIRRFLEKPRREEAPTRLANTGIYLLSPAVRELLDRPTVRQMIERGRLDFGLDFIPFVVREGYPVFGYTLEGEWYDLGTPAGYLATMLRVLRTSRRSLFYFGEPVAGLDRVWIQGESPEALRGRAEIVRKVREGRLTLDGSVMIGRHCQIGDGTTIRDSCIDNFCVVGEDVTIERSAIMDRVVLGDEAEVQDSIVGRHVRVKSSRSRPTWILGLSVIGHDVVIGEGCFIGSSRIFPHLTVPEGAKLADRTLESGS